MIVVNDDGLNWLSEHTQPMSIITSLPDISEILPPVEDRYLPVYTTRLRIMIEACLDATAPSCITVFHQHDRKINGVWLDKAHLIVEAALKRGHRVLWHKIALRHAIEKRDLYRPGYRHIICVSRQAQQGPVSPDVIRGGAQPYDSGVGYYAAALSVAYALRLSPLVVDPFGGYGTIPYIAELLGGVGISVDADKAQCERAEAFELSTAQAADIKAWLDLHGPRDAKS